MSSPNPSFFHGLRPRVRERQVWIMHVRLPPPNSVGGEGNKFRYLRDLNEYSSAEFRANYAWWSAGTAAARADGWSPELCSPNLPLIIQIRKKFAYIQIIRGRDVSELEIIQSGRHRFLHVTSTLTECPWGITDFWGCLCVGSATCCVLVKQAASSRFVCNRTMSIRLRRLIGFWVLNREERKFNV